MYLKVSVITAAAAALITEKKYKFSQKFFDSTKAKENESIEQNVLRETKSKSKPSYKRENYLSWNDYFMGAAFLSGMRSKDPITQVGACIVNQKKRIVGLGYNGMPNDCSDDVLPWGKNQPGTQEKDKLPLDKTKHAYVCHAEMNAIMNKTSASVEDCSIYVSLFPCNECAKIIIQAGIKKVYYYSDKHGHKPETIASKIMLEMAGVDFEQIKPKENITIDFSSIDI